MTPKESALTPQDVLSRLEAAIVLRNNLVAALGRVLLVCLDDNARVPFQSIHDAVRFRRVAAYELLRILPVLRSKPPQQQLYKLLRMVERIGSRFISGYAMLCVNVFRDFEVALMERASLADMLLNIDAKVTDSVSRDRHRFGMLPLSLQEGFDFLLRAARNDSRIMNLRIVSAILLNYPTFDLTDPEIHGAMRFVAQRMRERSRPEDPLLHDARQYQNAEDLLRTVLERLEVDELSSDATKEASSLLLQNLGEESYPPTPSWKHNLKKLLMITSDRYPVSVTVVAKYLVDHLDDSHLRDLDIGFYETGDHARLQVLSRLHKKPDLQHLKKPLSLLMTFISQKLMNDADHEYTVPISFYEVNDYLDSFDTPCLQDSIRDAMNTMRPHLSKNLPWNYAFQDRRMSDNPWKLALTSLAHLRSFPVNRSQAIAIDNFVYKGRADALTGKRGPLYSSGIIFQRDDTMDVEIDFYSLLMCIPNVFKSEKFVPLINFLSKPNILDILGYEFNKFDYETSRDLLLALLKRASALPLVKSDESLLRTLQNARNYLEEPLLINLYTTEDLEMLLKHLPGIENDPRYLPLKIFFKKQKLFEYLSPTFSLAGLHTPMEKLLLILKTVSLEVTEPKVFDALSFALENFEGSPLPVRAFNYHDFVYLTQQLLPHNKDLQTEILTSSVYTNISDWNVSVSGTPENVLARALSYPVDSIANDAKLAALVKHTEEILEEKRLLNIKSLKKRTLEALLEHLPNSTHVKPVSLLLKTNLMTFLPNLNLTVLESVSERDPRYALITLLRNLTESQIIRAEKLLLDRIETTSSSLEHANQSKRQIPIVAYLIQTLRDPSNIVYEPLLREMMQLRNVTIPPHERQVWLQIYLQQMIAQNKTEELKEAATMALREINMNHEDFSEKLRASRARFKEAVSLLPNDLFAEPLRQLLTPDWIYSILPEDLRNADSFPNKEQLLLAILNYAKQRTDVANNPVLMKAIIKTVIYLKWWRTSVKSLKSAIADVKAAVYDPVKNLLTAGGLNKLKVTIPPGRSAMKSLVELLQRLLLHPEITKNSKVTKLLRTVRQDLLAFGENVDLLAVLDDVGIPHISELAPIRLFLYGTDVIKQFGHTIFAIAEPKERYRTLLNILQKRHQTDNDKGFLDAFSLLRNMKADERKPASTLVSDLRDVVNAIPRHIKKEFKYMEYLFNNDTLSRLTSDNEIVESKTPLTTLLLKIANLQEVSNNYTAANELKRIHYEIALLGNYSIVTGFQLRPLLLVHQQIQQVNVDFMNSILSSEVLNYLDMEKFSNVTDDNIEILKSVIDHLLYKGSTYVDDNMQKHLQSFKRAMALTLDFKMISELRLTNIDLKRMLALIPHRKDFAPIRMLLQSGKIFEYVPYYKSINLELFPTSTKKLLHLLLLLENDDIRNKNVYESASKLRVYLEKRFNFVTEQDVMNMHNILASFGPEHDLSALKIFLNHDNIIKYLPSSFRYSEYDTSTDAFVGVLYNLLQVPSLKQETFLYEAMKIAKRFLQCSGRKQWIHNVFAYKNLSAKDLEFVNSFNVFEPRLLKFLNPEKLVSVLPKSFTFKNRVTFKTKASHLLRHLLELKTDVCPELEKLLRQVMAYADVPDITRDDLAPLLNILPTKEKIPHIELVKNYLKPSKLIRLLPGNFNIKQTRNAKVALHNILLLLNNTLGSAKSKKLETALHAFLSELDKINFNVVPEKPIIDNNDIKSIISEIPFKQYKQILQLEVDMTPTKLISSLPLSFQLTKYKTKKLQLLAVLETLSKNDTHRSSLDAINFARRIVSEMPDVPMVNDTEIKKLLMSLPLGIIHVTHLVKNCKVATLTPYLPIHFNLSSVESRKIKITKILRYCELANPKNVDMKQAFSSVKMLLKTASDFDVTRDHLEVLIGTIPCTHFSSIKPLLRFLSKTDVTSLLPWSLDLYETSRTFKQRILDLLAALRDIKELRNDKMLSAFESLEMNAKSLPDAVPVTPDHIAVLKSPKRFDVKSCADYGEFVTKTENLIKVMPPTYRFQPVNSNSDDIDAEWSSIMYLSTLFLRDVRVDGPMKDAFEACRDNIHTSDKNRVVHYLKSQINQVPFKETIVPLRLYVLGHTDTFTALIDNVHRSFVRATMPQYTRLVLREFTHRSELTRSKSLIDSLEVFLHDYVITQLRDTPSYYEVDQAISEIPNDDEYDDIRLLMQCRDIQTPIMEKNLSADGTTKQLLLDMLRLADKSESEEEMRENIKGLELRLEQAIREEEADHVLKQMRDYRYHINKMKPIKVYLVRDGLQRILGDDYRTKYPLYKDRLIAVNNTLMTATNLTSDLLTASKYLNKILKNEVKIKYMIPRTIDDINVQTLFFALPKTRDERIIHGIIKFFSNPNLLHELNLPKDPFEYETKGRLLQAIINLGMELESVQEDMIQQEALEYFSDKILITGHGAEPIELKKNAHDFNVNVDMYGVMRAVNYTKANVTDAVKVVMFFELDYNAVGFSHMAYATRGTYLKALLEHLVNVSQVPDDVKRSMTLLIPAVMLDGPGDEAVDLNDDIIQNETDTRTYRRILKSSHDTDSPSSGLNTSRADLLQTFQENKESLKSAVNNMFDSMSLSQKEVLGHINDQSSNTSALNNLTKTLIVDHAGMKNNDQNNRSNEVSETSPDISVIPKTLSIKYKVMRKTRRIKLKDNWSSNDLDNLNGKVSDVSFKAEKRVVKVQSTPSSKLSSEEQLGKSNYFHKTHHKRVTRKSPLQSNLNDNSMSFSLNKELMAAQSNDERKTVKKDLSRSMKKIS
ncbi:hypothetical protein DMN91_011094 [Ooceraea biroi]|uniref:Uncharacterized protein n=2 Tax=Ooceraea biroi TaxID=2015173 RepID=A0A3L8D928_OOCBI|nr:hypothetical protein DMN91_011094 [Ooceraea biroi]